MKKIHLIIVILFLGNLSFASRFHIVKLVEYPNGTKQFVSIAKQIPNSKSIIPYLELSNAIGELDQSGEFKFGHWTSSTYKTTTTWYFHCTDYSLEDVINAYNNAGSRQVKSINKKVRDNYVGGLIHFIDVVTNTGLLYDAQSNKVSLFEISDKVKSVYYNYLILSLIMGLVLGILFSYIEVSGFGNGFAFITSNGDLVCRLTDHKDVLMYSIGRILGTVGSLIWIIMAIIVSISVPVIWIMFILAEFVQFCLRAYLLRVGRYNNEDTSYLKWFKKRFLSGTS